MQAEKHVLLTGVTGFVGKVVLAELMRRRVELGIDRVTVLIREKANRDGTLVAPAKRFAEQVAQSPVFQRLASGWQRRVDVMSADLEADDCGLSPEDLAVVRARATHVIHCAASVDFDLPIQEAADANIKSALNVLELARRCEKLVGMVDVSTAYVAAWREGPIFERLAHLPRPAAELYDAIRAGSRAEKELLGESGHPNTYTYTKCVAEHLLSEQRGTVPLSIVRPSIISAAWREPFTGWIDSAAAFAGCLLYTGLGVVKAWNANPATRLDVVPVDVVADRILEAAFRERFPAPGEEVPIHFAVMGLERAMRADTSALSTARFFRERPGAKSLPKLYIGQMSHGFAWEDVKRRAIPMQALRGFYAVTLRSKERKRIEKANKKMRYLNEAFGYFTHNSFDFRPRRPAEVPGFTPQKYIDVVNRGMYRHLLKMDETQAPLAGEEHDDARSDLRWMTEKPDGTAAIRALGFVMRKALRRCTTKVTFDRESFERAVAAAPANSLFVLAPSHRSYFDFLLASYLCFQHPEIGIPVPHIAAAEEFSRIPVVGRFLKQTQAFYIRRGVGKAVPEVSEELKRIAARSASLMFFIEGQRSRGRRVLPPKRGLLRGLQATGRTFAVLPIAIAYEQVPEQEAFERELSGGARSKMSLKAIVKWSMKLARDEVSLGRVHLACGTPLVLDESTDVHELASSIAAELQNHTAITRFHVRAFLSQCHLANIDEAWLVQAIERRGGRVLDSDTPLPGALSPTLQQNLQNQWMHWFYPDALALFPDDPDVRDHVARNRWVTPPQVEGEEDPRLFALVKELFQPVVRDYALVTQHVDSWRPRQSSSPSAMVKEHPSAYLLHLEDAFSALAERGVLVEQAQGVYQVAEAGGAER